MTFYCKHCGRECEIKISGTFLLSKCCSSDYHKEDSDSFNPTDEQVDDIVCFMSEYKELCTFYGYRLDKTHQGFRVVPSTDIPLNAQIEELKDNI